VAGEFRNTWKTEDGGDTWVQHVVPDINTYLRLNGISAVDSDTAWCVGEGGKVFKTTNGEVWVNQTSPTSSVLRSVCAVDANTAWAVGEGGTIIKTTNGTEWGLVEPSPTTEDLYGLYALDANTAWAVGNNGVIIKTTNGTDWSAQTSHTGNFLNAVCATDAENAWAVGYRGTIVRTTNVPGPDHHRTVGSMPRRAKRRLGGGVSGHYHPLLLRG